MRLPTLLLCLFTAFSSYSQISPIQGLAETSYEKAGFHRDSIESLIQLIQDTPPRDHRGLVVIKDHKLVVEEYFHTFWRITVHDIRSAGKSITAMLLGIAMNEGLIQNLDQDVYSFFPPEKYPRVNKDYQKIKIRHLLDMSSGLDADSDRPETPGQARNWMAMDDWKEYLLNIPVVNTPGEKWVYADINAVLIGAIIEETSGMSLKDFAKEKLFDPLGIDQFYWYTNKANQTGAAGNLYLTTLDFAKLGLLVVNEGKWQGKPLMDSGYAQSLMTTKNFEISDYNPSADHYGMLWYKSQRTFGGKTFDYVFASGNGGNYIIIVPEHNIVMALTSSAYGPYHGHRRSYNIMRKVLSALK